MPSHTEPSINVALAQVLRVLNPRWRNAIHAEQVRVFRDSRAQPDLVVEDAVPVVVETEFMPARTVEVDAISRLDLIVKDSGRSVEHVVACRLPQWLKTTSQSLDQAVSAAEVEYCVFSTSTTGIQRWPVNGWVVGSVPDLADCLEMVRLSEHLIKESTEVLEQTVKESTFLINEITGERDSTVSRKLGLLLNQEPSIQTNRMAMTILANAFTFHLSIQHAHGLSDFESLKTDGNLLLPMDLLPCWRYVLNEINYWPIFEIATKIIECLGTQLSVEVFKKMERAATQLLLIGSTSIHDLSGRMLQRLITDRKFLATFYTLPNSAALLAELSVARLTLDFQDIEACKALKVADFACGTGTLITAAYQVILRKCRRAGSDESLLHSALMANGLIAADIMPAATHLTASQLSSTNPAITFDKTCVYTMQYGYQSDELGREVSLGSLDLLDEEETASIFGTGSVEISGTQQSDEVFEVSVKKESLDLVIMNPPFTRPTNHESTTVPVPSFAGFQTSDAEQRAMSDTLKRVRRKLQNSVGDGRAGLASDFVDLAHIKIKPGGVLALVLPLTVLQGASWQKVRSLLQSHYCNVTVVSLATSGHTEQAFSADTGLAEVLLVATKKSTASVERKDNCLYISLFERPRSVLAATEAAKAILQIDQSNKHGSLRLGKHVIGHFVRGSLSLSGCAATRSLDVVRAMLDLTESAIQLPRYKQKINIPLVPLEKLGSAGPVHRLIGQIDSEAPKSRGIFRILEYQGVPAYPVLWNHHTNKERSLVVQPDTYGEVRDSMEEAAIELWNKTATKLHFNADFRLNSQALGACFTPSKAIGGVAWPSFILDDVKYEVPLLLWCNSTLGLIARWWSSARQQEGRARLSVSNLSDLWVIDCRLLTKHQLSMFDDVFTKYKERSLLPANEAFRDQTRHELDQAILIDILGLSKKILESLALLRRQWCDEPSVHGRKSSRITLDDAMQSPVS